MGSGLVLAYLADEAGIPRRTVYGIWHGARRTSPETAAALLGLRPLAVADALPVTVRELDTLDAAGVNRRRRAAAGRDLDLRRRTVGAAAAELGVSRRTVQRWRSAQAEHEQGGRA